MASTVHEQGWDTFEDGPLLALAQIEFAVLLTIDGSLEFQQNLAKLRIGIVVVHVPKNQLIHYRAIREEVLLAIDSTEGGPRGSREGAARLSCSGLMLGGR